MGKTEKLLLLIAVLLTVVAGAFWYVNLTAEPEVNTEDLVPNTGGDPSPESGTGITGGGPGENVVASLDVLENFGVAFEVVDDSTVNLVLEGDTLNVRSVEFVLSYDPEVLSIDAVQNGDLFDFFISQDNIDAEAGLVTLPFSFSGENLEVLTDGVIATLTFTKLGDADAEISVLEFDSEAQDYTQLIVENGDKYTINESSVVL